MPPRTVGPVVTLAAAALVGAGLLTADAVTDPCAPEPRRRSSRRRPRPPPRRPRPRAGAVAHDDHGSASTSVAPATPATAAAYLSPRSTSAATPPGAPAWPWRSATGRWPPTCATAGRSSPGSPGRPTGTTATLTAGADRLVTEVVGRRAARDRHGSRPTGRRHRGPGSAPAGLYRLDAPTARRSAGSSSPTAPRSGSGPAPASSRPRPSSSPDRPSRSTAGTAYPQEVSGDDRF